MEQKVNKLFRSTKAVGIWWIVFAAIGIIIEKNTGEITFPAYLLIHIMFFILFASGLLAFTVLFTKQNKYEKEEEKSQNEFERKKDWEELYKEDRLEKQRYETIKSLIEKLDDKEIKKDHPLKEEIEKFREEITEWKKQKDKQLFVEIKNSSSKSKKSE